MAFKKTSGQRVFAQPTGIPNLSGFKQAAAAYDQLAQTAMSIGTDIRKREYNDAIRQAEIDGKTAGVTYDQDNNLVPLTNLNYGKEISLYSSGEQQGVRDAYKKAAITSYTSAASNDIRIAAAKALSESPNDPDPIRGSLAGYMESLKKLDPDIYASLAPKAVAEYTIAENKALAQQQLETKQYNIQQNLDAFKANAVKLGVHGVAGKVNDDYLPEEGQQLFISELAAEQEQIKEALKADGYSDQQILQLENMQNTVVMSRTAQAAVERSFVANGEVATYQLIRDLKLQAAQTEGIDASKVNALLNSTMSGLISIQSAQNEEERKFRSSIYSGFYRSIIIDGYDINQEFSNPESAIHTLDGTQQATLYTTARDTNKSLNERIANANLDIYANLKAELDNPEVTSVENTMAAMQEITRLAESRQLGPESHKLLREAQASYLKAENYYLTKDIGQAGAFLQTSLGPMSGFIQTPGYYLNEMFISGLEKKGIIGENGYYSTRKEFINAVEAYDKLYTERKDKLRLATQAEEKAMNGYMPNAQELDALSEAKGFDKVFVNGQAFDFSLTTSDESVFQASMDAVAAFAVMTDGLLHPEAKIIFENAIGTPETADRAMRVMGQAKSAIRAKFPNEREDFIQARFDQQLDMDTIEFLRIADRVGIETALEAAQVTKNMNRGATANFAADKYGATDADTLFNDTFAKAIEGKGFFKFFQPNISPEDNQMLYQMAARAGQRNIEGAFIADPYIKMAVEGAWKSHLMKYPQAEPVATMRSVLGQIGKRMGVQENPETGELEFVQDPILKQAQATVGNAGITLIPADIDNDIKDRFLIDNRNLLDGMGARVKEELALVGTPSGIIAGGRPAPTLHYIANENYGATPSYTVVMKDSYGKLHNLTDSYTYDFKQTKAFGINLGQSAYSQALTALETDRAKKFWSAVGIMDQTILNSTFRRIESGRKDVSLQGLVNLYNNVVGGYRMNYMDEAPLTEQEAKEFLGMIDLWRQLGW